MNLIAQNYRTILFALFLICVGYLISDTFRGAVWGFTVYLGIMLVLEAAELIVEIRQKRRLGFR